MSVVIEAGSFSELPAFLFCFWEFEGGGKLPSLAPRSLKPNDVHKENSVP